MKRIALWLFSTLTVVVLLFGYHTSLSPTASTNAATVASAPAGSTEKTAVTSGGSTFTGDAIDTRFGPVQVQITVANGKITAVQVLQYPYRDHRDQEINSRALPVLIDETVSAQSADIDMVSGATITSDAYVDSLQSAIDQADLA
ncbi:MAG: FMN-binding protein [Nocardiaceae bacterium]|nr:FMN-binding protein [Nocardiaceae bacterium]